MSLSLIDAVNLCLQAVGYETVPSSEDIETTDDYDQSQALSAVKNQMTLLQSHPWWFNTEKNWKLSLNTIGQIDVPQGATSVISSGEDYWSRNLIVRGGRLYDTYEHNYDLTSCAGDDGYVVVTLLMELPWDDIPPVARTLIAYMARQQYALDEEIDQFRYQAHQVELTQARDSFYAENARNRKTNMFTDNSANSAILNQIGGQNSRGYQYRLFPRRSSY